MGGKGDRPPGLENRWWIDQDKDQFGQPTPRPPAQFGNAFFRTGAGYEQHAAQRRLTDSNLKWFAEAPPPNEHGWSRLALLGEEQHFSPRKTEKVLEMIRVPKGGHGVLVDSGVSLRAIIANNPQHERLIELRLGRDSSFDAWVRGEWVREVIFHHFDDALRRAPRLVRQYLTTNRAEPLI